MDEGESTVTAVPELAKCSYFFHGFLPGSLALADVIMDWFRSIQRKSNGHPPGIPGVFHGDSISLSKLFTGKKQSVCNQVYPASSGRPGKEFGEIFPKAGLSPCESQKGKGRGLRNDFFPFVG